MMDRPDPDQFAAARAAARWLPPPDAPLAMPRQALSGPVARVVLRRVPGPGAGTLALRAMAVAASMAAALAALSLLMWIGGADGLGFTWAEILRTALGTLATWWLAWGAALALIGLACRTARPSGDAGLPLGLRGVVLVPVCNENPAETFARIAATARSLDEALAEVGEAARFDIAILSDTRDPGTVAAEAAWLPRLAAELRGTSRLIYRHRSDNAGRKAGNIEEFLRRSGAAWDVALVLDADSLMEGRTILAMARRMQADPGLGLLQTLPRVIRARSRFGRAMQFAAALHGPVFARGLAALQGPAGPFWGHNAMLRIAAFAGACGLPQLPGRAPFGGGILSHDTVEAAFLVRAGWRVRLDPDLGGSYEEAPDNLIDHARRDRRWCQGNLQHVGVIGAAGLAPWSRFSILQGVMSYLAPVLWLAFLAVTLGVAATAPEPAPVFDELGRSTFFPVETTGTAIALGAGVLALLFLPKLMIAADAVITGRAAQFGGARAMLRSTLAEMLLSSVIAPIQMMFQSRAVAQVLAGRDAGWPSQDRAGGRVALSESLAVTRGFVLAGAGALVVVLAWAPALVLWLLPVALPLAAAPLLVTALSAEDRSGLFRVPEDTAPATAMRRLARLLLAWRGARAVPDVAPEAGVAVALAPAG
ncbi:MAG TPA: glucans biosynthesis glucosyltransferase MdoH [Paracoccaceae bacterium]|nr:glucans biosynthesis glucosyltransferase MdoH [Paracoccaceae bacterium]